MSKIDNCINALERRQRYLEHKLKTDSILYAGRSYDEAENGALKYVISMLKEKKEHTIKISNKDKEAIEKRLGFNRSGIEYTPVQHTENVFRSEAKSNFFGGVYR